MRNPLSATQWSKLDQSMVWSDRQLEFPKRQRIQAINDMVGYHYAEYGSAHRQPVPMLALAVQIYVRMLASGNPRALATTSNPELKHIAANLELAINQIPDEIELSATIRKAVMEALFCFGVVKIGLCEYCKVLNHSYGEIFVDLVPIDDYFIDMSAKTREKISYEGNTYWTDYEELMESDFLSGEERDSLKPDEYTTCGPAGENRAEQISADSSADEYRDRVWLRDVWLPREKLVLTMGNITRKLLKVVEWEGPENGPYPKLGFSDVPGNLLPLPPVSLWRDLHELSNKLFRKLGAQADNAKSVMGFQGGDEESVDNFKKASDGEGIRYTGQEPKTLTTPGVDAKTMAFYLQCRDLFSYYAGNLDSLGGLGQQTATLGQDKLLGAAASAQMKDMSDAVITFVQEIFYQLAFYEWNDPVKRRQLQKPIPGTDLTIPVEWNKKSKKGKFSMYDIGLDIYSLQDNSPGVRLQKMGQIMKEYILPLVQPIKEAGGTIDVQKILKLVGKYADFPELEEVVTFADGPGQPAPQSQSQGQPKQDTTTTRVGQPGMTQSGGDRALQQVLMGGDDGAQSGPGPIAAG